MLASVGRSHHILSTCCESNALCVVVLVEASVTPRGVKLPEKCRTLQTRHGMGAPSEDHTTPPSSRTPSSSRGFSRTPAPQRSRRRRRAAIQRRRDGQARGAAWAARLLSPAWRSGGAAQGAARRPLGPLLRPTAGQTRAGTSLSTILPWRHRSLARSPSGHPLV